MIRSSSQLINLDQTRSSNSSLGDILSASERTSTFGQSGNGKSIQNILIIREVSLESSHAILDHCILNFLYDRNVLAVDEDER